MKKNEGVVELIFVLLGLVSFLIVLPLVFLFASGVRPFQVKGDSMAPAYPAGMYVLTAPLVFAGNPKQGDVVIFQSPLNQNVRYIKRVVALPENTVKIYGGEVYVGGEEIQEPYRSQDKTHTFENGFMKEGESVTVPWDTYFVLGDNRDHSNDSRSFGFVPKEKMIGKILFCYWNCTP